jgi:small subunit ribosomal protein S6
LFPEDNNGLAERYSKSAEAIALNIAEGSSRNKSQFVYYLKMAKSAVRECVVFTAICKYQDYLTEKGAEIVHEEHWGMRKLAYPIQKKSTGFYHLVEFRAEGALIADLETQLKRDERIIRFLTVKLDKHAIAYNEKKRRKAKETAKEKVEA